MKNINIKLLLLLIIVIFFTSCNNIKKNNDNISSITWNINSNISDIKENWTWGIFFDNNTFSWILNWTLDISIEEKVKLATVTEDEVIKILEKIDDWDYLEELKYIEKVFNEKILSYHIFMSLSKSDIKECNKIKTDEKIEYCKYIYNNITNKYRILEYIDNFENWELDEKDIFDIYYLYKNISDNNEKCDNIISIFSYLSCKKFFNKDFEIRKILLYYERITRWNVKYWKEYYKEILEYWGMEQELINLVEDFYNSEIYLEDDVNPFIK